MTRIANTRDSKEACFSNSPSHPAGGLLEDLDWIYVRAWVVGLGSKYSGNVLTTTI